MSQQLKRKLVDSCTFRYVSVSALILDHRALKATSSSSTAGDPGILVDSITQFSSASHYMADPGTVIKIDLGESQYREVTGVLISTGNQDEDTNAANIIVKKDSLCTV